MLGIMETQMGERKITFDKNWWQQGKKARPNQVRKAHKFEQERVLRPEDLPQLIPLRRAADMLGRHFKTVEELRAGNKIRFQKMGGRWFTTPEWIADYLRSEWSK
jgi:hypothetical protein